MKCFVFADNQREIETACRDNPSGPSGHLPLHRGGFGALPFHQYLRMGSLYPLPGFSNLYP